MKYPLPPGIKSGSLIANMIRYADNNRMDLGGTHLLLTGADVASVEAILDILRNALFWESGRHGDIADFNLQELHKAVLRLQAL